MSQTVPMTQPPVRDNDQVLEHFADGAVGINFLNGNLHITFATVRMDHSTERPSQHRQVTLRLVIPLGGARELQNQITQILSALQQQSRIQSIMPAPQTRQ